MASVEEAEEEQEVEKEVICLMDWTGYMEGQIHWSLDNADR